MSQLFDFQDLQPRWASPENPGGGAGMAHRGDDGRKRRPCVPLPAGGRLVLAEASGQPGTVRRIWLTFNHRTTATLRGLRLRMTWDGAAEAAVDVPLGDFFCHGAGRMSAFENELFASPEGRSCVSLVPMPFRDAMRIELLNESASDQAMVFYDVDYTLGDRHGEGMLYFHAHWRREAPTVMRRDFTVLPQVAGRGRLLGANLSVLADTATWGRTWWGEGEMKIFLDGDTTHPTLCGTGTEDWIGTAWGQGRYANRSQGCPLADTDASIYSFYRLHLADPVFFRCGIRATMQQIGWTGADRLADLRSRGVVLELGGRPIDLADHIARNAGTMFERTDDWAACTWFYLDRPASGLPGLAPVAERIAGLDRVPAEVQAKGPGEAG